MTFSRELHRSMRQLRELHPADRKHSGAKRTYGRVNSRNIRRFHGSAARDPQLRDIMKSILMKPIILLVALCSLVSAQRGRGDRPPGADMNSFPRPIEMHDTVWIEEMTQLEIRDSLKAGKTSAIVMIGGMEDNGPYVIVSQHNSIGHAMCDMIARKVGNTLCGPVIGMAPGNPDKSPNPGSVVLSPETFKGNVSDIASSLRGQGFRHIFFMVDHGSDQKPAVEAIDALNQKWKGEGATAYYVKEFYNYTELEKYEADVLGVHEKTDGFHDDYYTASISLAIDPETLRMPERIKAKKTMLNGQDMKYAQALEDGRKMMQYRLDAACARHSASVEAMTRGRKQAATALVECWFAPA